MAVAPTVPGDPSTLLTPREARPLNLELRKLVLLVPRTWRPEQREGRMRPER